MTVVSAVRRHTMDTDEELVSRIAGGDPSAFEEAYQRHNRAVARAVLTTAGSPDRAEEAVQDVFARLWHDPARYDPTRGSLRAFLAVDGRNRALDAARSDTARRRREDHDLATTSLAPDTEEIALSAVVSSRVSELLNRLRPEERFAISLAYVGGQSYREVAIRLGLPEGTVKSRIKTGLGKLESMLIAEGLDL